MKKTVITIILLMPFFVETKYNCTSWERKEFKTGVLKSNSKFKIKDCTCPCTGPRTEKNICLECGHGHRPETLFQAVKDDAEEAYEYAIDLVSTNTGRSPK